MRQKHWNRGLVLLFLTIHAVLLIWSAWCHSPLIDEPAHLASGLHHWHTFSFDLYRVNPPLVRSVAAIPLLILQPQANWDSYSDNPYQRAEFSVGNDFFKANENARLYLFSGRLFCIPFSLLGGFVCYLWAKNLFGDVAGFLALILWCFSSMILAFGYTIMPDVASAALGVSACYLVWKWSKQQNYVRAITAGFVLGLAELCKFSLLILYPVFIIAWMVSVWTNRKNANEQTTVSQIKQIVIIFATSIFIINMGYGFEGSGLPLKDFEFISRTLCGNTKWNHETGFTPTGNRFRETLLGYVPVPLPANYLLGIDVQKYDFEIGRDSYLFGQWSKKGWYSYYFWGLLVKEPIALWGLLLLASVLFIASSKYRADTFSEMLLLVPVLAIFVLVSSQPKLNHHLRYIIPLLPCLFIFAVRIGRSIQYRHWPITMISVILTLWLVVSVTFVCPHYQAYFNELVRSPFHVKYFTDENPPPLLGSNIDWEQNVYFLKQWYDEHDTARPIFIDYASREALERLGIQAISPPKKIVPGWYAIGVNELFDSSNRYEYFRTLSPTTIIGYSIYVYHITTNGEQNHE